MINKIRNFNAKQNIQSSTGPTFSGTVTIRNTLSVTGSTQVSSLESSGNVTVSKILSVSGSAQVINLYSTNAAQLGSSDSDQHQITGSIFISGSHIVSGSFEIHTPLERLSNKPVPPDSTVYRGMYVWLYSTPNDPMETLSKRQTLLNFCRNNYVNLIFLDIYSYLGGDNWNNNNAETIRQFVDVAHRSGIQVHAMAGDVDWGRNQHWVMTNVIRPLADFNAQARYISERFDGLHFDVEYWVNDETTPSGSHLPGLCDLINATRRVCGPGFKVSCFAARSLKDNTETRNSITYNGNSKQDGAHLIDVSDFVVVATYADDSATQISQFQAWYDYASVSNKQLFAASETLDVAPANITYYGSTKSAMATQHASIASNFRTGSNSVFLGQAVHDYRGWSVME